jgi:hypothetical protein
MRAMIRLFLVECGRDVSEADRLTDKEVADFYDNEPFFESNGY